MPGFAVDFLRRQLNEPTSATRPPSATPTASTEHKGDGGIPEIGGSEAGFIALIVGLSIIFLGSCIGVFYLLRNYKHGGRTVRGKSGEVGVEAPPTGGFPRRRGTLFGFRSQNPKRAGWVRASGEDEDDWDAADDTIGGLPYDPGYGYSDPVKLERSAFSERNAPHGEFEVTLPNLEFTPRGTPQRRKDESSVSTVDLDTPGRGPQDEPLEPPPRSTSPDSSLAHYAAYIDHLENRQDGQTQYRQGSVDSAQTMATFPGGTKFKEDF